MMPERIQFHQRENFPELQQTSIMSNCIVDYSYIFILRLMLAVITSCGFEFRYRSFSYTAPFIVSTVNTVIASTDIKTGRPAYPNINGTFVGTNVSFHSKRMTLNLEQLRETETAAKKIPFLALAVA